MASIVLLGLLSKPVTLMAHPASGIVVSRTGEIFITDVRRGVIKIDSEGKLSTIDREGYHWLALDSSGAFSKLDFSQLSNLHGKIQHRGSTGALPALITASDSAVAISSAGELYFVCDGQMRPGDSQIARIDRQGRIALLSPELSGLSTKLGGIRDLAIGPDGSVYASYAQAVVKVSPNGKIASIVDATHISDCERNPPSIKQTPFLRGIAVDVNGVVYVAATGCRRVISIRPDSTVQIVSRTEAPWSPSGVAVHEGAVYVLEHVNGNSDKDEDWPPRVRKIDPQGRRTVLLDLSQ
ncbi:MAG TPA: hypothetical protein VGE93_19755 [Bryobacteraceae bacterium]